jgi:hypothetical protein
MDFPLRRVKSLSSHDLESQHSHAEHGFSNSVGKDPGRICCFLKASDRFKHGVAMVPNVYESWESRRGKVLSSF